MPFDEANEHLDLIFKSAQQQVALNKQVLANHLDAADQIAARAASQTLVKAAGAIAENPTS